MSEQGKIVLLTESELESLLRRAVSEAVKATESNPRTPKLGYSTEDAAKILGVPKPWLARAAREKKIRSVKAGHYVLFSLVDLEEFLGKSRKESS